MPTHRLPTRRNYKHHAPDYKPGTAPGGAVPAAPRPTEPRAQLTFALGDCARTAATRLTLHRPGPACATATLGPGLAAFRAWGLAQIADARGWLPRAFPTERPASSAGGHSHA